MLVVESSHFLLLDLPYHKTMTSCHVCIGSAWNHASGYPVFRQGIFRRQSILVSGTVSSYLLVITLDIWLKSREDCYFFVEILYVTIFLS